MPLESNSLMLPFPPLPPLLFATQMLPEVSRAMPKGLFIPPEPFAEVNNSLPAGLNWLMELVSLFVSQTLPDPSTATMEGPLKLEAV